MKIKFPSVYERNLTQNEKDAIAMSIKAELERLEGIHAEKLRKCEETLKILGRKWIMQAAAVDLQRNKVRSQEIEIKLQSEAAKFRGVRYGKL